MERELKDLTSEELEKFETALKKVKQQKQTSRFKEFLHKPWKYVWNSDDNYSGWNSVELYLFPLEVLENGDIKGIEVSNDRHYPYIKQYWNLDVSMDTFLESENIEELTVPEFYTQVSKVLGRITRPVRDSLLQQRP